MFQDIQETTDQQQDAKIKVCIRKRPLNKKELTKNEFDIIEVKTNQSVVVKELKQKVDLTKFFEEHSFNFDHAFNENCSNEQIYNICIRPIVKAAFKKAKVTCFAYGQTGSGKTHTMLGNIANRVPGMYVLAGHDIFQALARPEFCNLQIFVSFYEIYCAKLFDLLNERQLLCIREDGKQNINIVGLTEQKIFNIDQLLKIIEFGMSSRVTSSNSSNCDSSRSHAILQIQIKEQNSLYGKISFIDLAGSERGADVVDQSKQTRKDGSEINKSLLALKECIRALDQGKNYTPFRGSKLTLVLKDSFTGNCRTVMIGNISPSQTSSEHTLNTLRYADRVKELKKTNDNELNEQVNSLDQLAQQLMLPRQQKNTIRTYIVNENNNENIQNTKLQQMLIKSNNGTQQQMTKSVNPSEQKPQKSNNLSLQKPLSSANNAKFNAEQKQGQINYAKDNNWTAKNGEDLQTIQQKHEQLINLILAEEEEVISTHRTHIDDMVELTKQEMQLLNEVDKPASDVDAYVDNLENILKHKSDLINYIRSKLQTFKSHLKKEEILSKKFYQQRDQIMDVFDLNEKNQINNFEDMQLLDDLPNFDDN